jgi:hypothetical protein
MNRFNAAAAAEARSEDSTQREKDSQP